MGQNDEVERLLEDIREIQREHLEEYRRVTERILKHQEVSLAMQAEVIGRQRRSLVGVFVVVLIALALMILVANAPRRRGWQGPPPPAAQPPAGPEDPKPGNN